LGVVSEESAVVLPGSSVTNFRFATLAQCAVSTANVFNHRCRKSSLRIKKKWRKVVMPSLSLEWFIPFFQGILAGLLAMVLHECGHLIAAWAVGMRIRGVGFSWKGMYTMREAGPPAKNLLISLAGPFTNLLLMVFWLWSPTFGLANLCFMAFNLVPFEGADGERALKCWRQMRQPKTSLAAD
jgi:hypothetical protein